MCAPLVALIVVTHHATEPYENYWLGRLAIALGYIEKKEKNATKREWESYATN
jgi:hypothetical protein